jgi:hypothetical protein
VLEGVLANVEPVEADGFFQRLRPQRPVVGFELTWLPLPIKRLASLIRIYDVDVDVVTFLSSAVADQAAEFFHDINLAVSTVSYQPFGRWCQHLPYTSGIQQIIDSDQDRLDRYGQLGRSVVRGEDW